MKGFFLFCFQRILNGSWKTAAEFQWLSLDNILCKWVTGIGHVQSKRNIAFYYLRGEEMMVN